MAGGPAQGCVLCGIIEGFYALITPQPTLGDPIPKRRGGCVSVRSKGQHFVVVVVGQIGDPERSPSQALAPVKVTLFGNSPCQCD